jgi:hypothetical protein
VYSERRKISFPCKESNYYSLVVQPIAILFVWGYLVGLMAGDNHSYLAISFCPQQASVTPGVLFLLVIYKLQRVSFCLIYCQCIMSLCLCSVAGAMIAQLVKWLN